MCVAAASAWRARLVLTQCWCPGDLVRAQEIFSSLSGRDTSARFSVQASACMLVPHTTEGRRPALLQTDMRSDSAQHACAECLATCVIRSHRCTCTKHGVCVSRGPRRPHAKDANAGTPWHPCSMAPVPYASCAVCKVFSCLGCLGG